MKIAIILFILFSALGIGLLVFGVYLLAGLGYSLLAGSASSFLIAWFIRLGLTVKDVAK